MYTIYSIFHLCTIWTYVLLKQFTILSIAGRLYNVMQDFIFTLSILNLKIIQSEAGKWITGIRHIFILQYGITIILTFYVFVVHVHDHVSRRLHIQQRNLKNTFFEEKIKTTEYIQRLTLIEICTQFFLLFFAILRIF